MNRGVFGLPPGRGVADAQSVQAYGGKVTGSANLHYVNLPMPMPALVPGLLFRYTPQLANTGAVHCIVNGFGPLELLKNTKTTTTGSPVALRSLEAGDLIADRTVTVMYRDGIFELLTGFGPNPSNLGMSMLGATTASAMRTLMELGTAATMDAGTGANQLVRLTAGGALPEVSGSNLTGLADNSLGNLTTIGGTRIVRAWGVFRGSDAHLWDSLGVSSITRLDTGRYRVDLNPAMPNIRYAVGFSIEVPSDDVDRPRYAYVEEDSRAVDQFIILTALGASPTLDDLPVVSFTLSGG